jgi:hypothetical protein
LEGNGETVVKADIVLVQLCASLRSQATEAEANVQDVEAHRLKRWLRTVEQLCDTTAILTAMANVNNTEPTASCRVGGGN